MYLSRQTFFYFFFIHQSHPLLLSFLWQFVIIFLALTQTDGVPSLNATHKALADQQ